MATKKKINKSFVSTSIELPVTPTYAHFIRIDNSKVTYCCLGNNKWVTISPIEDIANELNYCPYCGAKLDGLELHKSVSRLIKPNERFSG